ncbi:annexin D8 [Amborella trichopoda]|uniref:Annexin n=1 Tax=Amborella trichopoda TaxID=13333 RepID=W1NEN1_AMBTC|nr:annexin D8 [Amborella trichopoda]ERM93595.1 hypothetical protein AMTR_s00004p00124750 [Amborella trichopoda]|eukprot:XP_006826358.1 annexin D8 [Amborella trichopoda]
MASTPLPIRHVCEEIHDTWGRLGHLVRALAKKNWAQRHQILQTYRAMYGEDLLIRLQLASQLKDSRSETFKLVFLWMLEPCDRDAFFVRDALEKGNTKALVEVYVDRKSSQLLLIKQAYLARFKRHMDHDIASEPPQPYQRILMALATSHKSHDKDVDMHIAKCDAKRVYEASEGRFGMLDESSMIEIFSKRSIPQLKRMLSCYNHIYGHDFTKSLKKKTTGEFEESLRTTIKCMYTPTKYYAKILHTCVKGCTSDRSALARVLMSRAEIDIEEIRDAFHAKYGVTLLYAIQQCTPTGEYRDFLLALATS